MAQGDPPLNADEARQVRALHAEGKGRNEITRLTGITNARVSRFCKDNDLKFVRKLRGAPVATKVRQQTMRERREAIASQSLDVAKRLFERTVGEYSYYERNGKDELVLVTLPEPPLRDARDAASGAATALTSHLQIVETLGDKTAEEEKSMLANLMDAFKVEIAREDAETAE